jgi:glutaredoxin
MAASSLDAVRLYRMDLPDHACPWGFRAMQLLQERHIPFEGHRLTSAEEVEAFKAAHGVATTPQIFSGDERIGGYGDLAARLGVRAESADISYAPVVAVFLTAGLMALVLATGVGAVAVLLGALGMVSVGKAVFIDHLALNCACVGGNAKTPLGVVSFAENLIMAAMGAVMLAGR